MRTLDEDDRQKILALHDDIRTIRENHRAQIEKIRGEIREMEEKHEQETDILKKYIVDMKGRLAVYIPVKTDPTDVGLAEFMNNFPDKSKLKIMFDREKEGIYMFGTRRVTIKVNRGKPQVKIGGGFMPIEDFID